MRSKILEDLLKSTSLESRVKVSIQSYFLNEYDGYLLTPLDENGNDIPEVIEKNEECFKKAQPLLDLILKEIKEWKDDGCPE